MQSHSHIAYTGHIKNTRVICRMPKTLYGMLPYLFLIHSFSTLLITIFIFNFLFLFFFQKVTFGFSYTCSFKQLKP